MKYRLLGKTGLEVSALGFGCMRLPKDKETGKIDRDASLKILHRAHELGVNFFDTAYLYDGGDSERTLGELAKEVGRKKLIINTKNWVGHQFQPIDKHTPTRDLWRRALEEELDRLGTDYIDCYLFHDISLTTYRILVHGPTGLICEAQKAKEEGLIRHIGLSSHDTPANIVNLLKMAGDAIEMIVVQYNLLDRSNSNVLDFATDNNMGVVIMGSLGAGKLVAPSSAYEAVAGASTTAELALRFVLANPAVSTAMSGMEAIEHVEENAATASNEDLLSAHDLSKIDEIQKVNAKLLDLYCTGCGYCMPCPHGINIPGNFTALNLLKVHGLKELAKSQYERLGEAGASNCAHCGECAGKCPQDISIEEKLGEVVLDIQS